MDQSVTSKRAAAQRQPDDPDRHYLMYCDESGLHGTRLTGFGSLWMTYERRGDFQQIWRDLAQSVLSPERSEVGEVKKETQPFFEALVDEFFRRKWLMFHCLLISKQDVNLSLHKNNWDLAAQTFHAVLGQQDSTFCSASEALHDPRLPKFTRAMRKPMKQPN